MTDQPITHKCAQKDLPNTVVEVLETTNKNGVICVWSGSYIYHEEVESYEVRLSWSFYWSELKETGIDALSGHITVKCPLGYFHPLTIEVNLIKTPQVIETSIENIPARFGHEVMFEYRLIPQRLQIQEEGFYDEMFLPSELNDTILVIDEKKLHVNRAFLSYHSEFFRALFFSKFKEGQMDEIPIKDVSYADFGLLMSTIYPNTVFPDDKTAEKLLELADRFLIPSVIRHVEFHLLRDTGINSEKVIWLADKYGMSKLFEKCMKELKTFDKVKKLHTSPEYEKLSKDAKVEIFDRLMKFI